MLFRSIFLSSFFGLSSEAKEKKATAPSFLLLISEQNIAGPHTRWWMGEIDLSTVEANLAGVLIKKGYKVITPLAVSRIIKREQAFKRVFRNDDLSLKLAKISQADYVIVGKAIASKGPNVVASQMFSCFANATVKLIRVKNGDVLAYLDSSEKTISLDVVSGGKKALAKVGKDLGYKIIKAVSKLEIGRASCRERV